MKILLVSASYPTPFTFHRKFLGLGYLHAYAVADPFLAGKAEIDHRFYDTRRKDAARIAEEIAACAPDLVGLACYVWNTADVLDIVARLKERAPGIPVLLGGPEVDYHYTELLDAHRGVDFISVGEGEETFRELLHALIAGGDPEAVPGIALRRKTGPPLAAPRAPAEGLDRFPSPYLSGVMEVDPVQGGVYLQTSRGCPFNCAYCDFGRHRPVGYFSLERVEAEIDFFHGRGAEKVFCVDATFNLNRDRAVKILEHMADLSLQAALWVEVYPYLLDEAFMKAVSRTHLTYLGIGLQTTNPEAMKHINRDWDPDRIAVLLDGLAQYKHCLLGLEIIMGLPGDNLAAFKDSITWVYEREPTNVFAFNLQVLPMTPLQLEADRFGIVEGGVKSGHEIISNNTFPAEEIVVGKAMTEWNRQMQPVFYRLVRVTGLSAGDVIEGWAWHAYRQGLHEALPVLHRNRVEGELLNRLAVAFETFCKDLFAREGLPDVSLHLREFLRYFYVRRSVTSETAVFTDALDVDCITRDSRYNRILEPGETTEEASIPGDAREETFEFDMARLWPLTTPEAYLALEQGLHTYRFFTGKRGVAMAVKVRKRDGFFHV